MATEAELLEKYPPEGRDPRPCSVCGAEHDGSYWWAKYCSEPCRAKSEGWEPSPTKALETPQKPFEERSEDAVALAREEWFKATHPIVQCVGCSAEFHRKFLHHRYCSQECRERVKGIERPPYSKVCSVCGEDFQAARRDAKFCSDACRLSRYRTRVKNANKIAKGDDYLRHVLNDPCVYCGGEATGFDHIHPRVKGGTDEWTNLAACCGGCNSCKSDQPLLLGLFRTRLYAIRRRERGRA